MAENNILSQLQDLLKNFKLNDLIKQAEVAKDEEVKAEEKQGGGLTDVLKSVTKGGGILGILKVLKMLKSFQGGKIFGNLGKISGLSCYLCIWYGLSSDDTEVAEWWRDIV